VRKSELEKLDELDVEDVLDVVVVLVEERALMLMADLDRCPASVGGDRGFVGDDGWCGVASETVGRENSGAESVAAGQRKRQRFQL
jgi:hypothetical protein